MPAPIDAVENQMTSPAGVATSPRASSRRGLRGAGLSLLALLVVLAGCSSGMRQPTDYGEINAKGEGFYGNFMYGCTGVEPTDGKYTGAKLGSEDYCKCVFTGLKKTVDFSDVRAFEEAQAEAKADNPPKVPKGIEKVRKDCASSARS